MIINEFKINKNFRISKKNIEKTLYFCFSRGYIVNNLHNTRKSTFGKATSDECEIFFKIKAINEGINEINNYLKIYLVYPVPKLKAAIKFKNRCILLYEYNSRIEKKMGLLFDYLNKDKINVKKFDQIISIYKKTFKRTRTYKKDYPLKKYFYDRINTRIEKCFLKDNRISKILKYKIKVNDEYYEKSTLKIVESAIAYFNKRPKELCFLTQGDPEPINIGTEPIFLDFETSGINPLVAEFAIFLWGVFMEESYYAPKYNRNCYVSRIIFTGDMKNNKPEVKVKIDYRNRVLGIRLNYRISNARREMIRLYLTGLVESIREGEDVLERLKYFMVLRILGIFDLRKYSFEDLFSSIGFLHIFCNSLVKKDLNMKDRIIEVIRENGKYKSKGIY